MKLTRSTSKSIGVAPTLAVTAGILAAAAPWHTAQAAGEVVAQGGSIQLRPSDVQALIAGLPQAQRQSAVASLGSLEQAYLRGLAAKLDITVDQIELAQLQESPK